MKIQKPEKLLRVFCLCKVKTMALNIERCSSISLVRKYGTPLYVYSVSRIRENYKRIYNAFKRFYPNFRLHYSIKTNGNLAILKMLRGLGAAADASSSGEVYLAQKAGMKKILYSGVYYRDDEIRYGVKNGAVINLDDPQKLRLLKKLNYKKPVCFRLNPGIGHGKFERIVTGGKKAKFGIVESEIYSAYAAAKNLGFKNFGIHMMTGSCILDKNYFARATSILLDIAGAISRQIGIKFAFVDIGGGFGIPYEPGEKELDIEFVGKSVAKVLKAKNKKYSLGTPTLLIEPGRYIVGDACVLLTSVTSIKNKPKKFVGVDAGMNTLLRPMLYGAYHPIIFANHPKAKPKERVTIVGPICESTDILAKDRLLPRLKEGDILAILNAGAYGFSMSSTYGGRPRPAEVLVRNNKTTLIRKRGGFESLVDH